MNRKIIITIGLTAIGLWLWSASSGTAQERKAPQKYECAIIKYDGPDRIQLILPNRFENLRLYKQGVVLPKEAQDEAFCLAYAANELAKEGWEPVGIDSTRVLMKRPVQ